jgi:tetratricopeptide (TPR) repeat protein
VSDLAGRTIGIIGALVALPRRIAAREVAARGGTLLHGATRQTATVVFGRGLLSRGDDAAVAARAGAARGPGRTLRSENGFLRLLAATGADASAMLDRAAMLEQSGLGAADFDLLALFDAFEQDVEPFTFRDLILARKYAGLTAGGAAWGAIARSLHRSGPVVSLTAASLAVGEGRAIHLCHEGGRSELDGQMLLDLGGAGDGEADELFARAEAAEADGDVLAAAALYERCLALDPGDAVAAFNRSNCLGAAGQPAEAELALVRALRLDPAFVEAWFNLAGLVAAQGRGEAARRHLARAIAIDPDYADAVFNLARLAFEAGDLEAARRGWERYLELDRDSEWAEKAQKGLRVVALQARDAAG